MAPYKSTVLGPQYGNGFLGIGNTRNVQSTRQIGLEALLDTFLGNFFFGTLLSIYRLSVL